jgi:predicted RNA-binding Zn ribbon-like protein
MGCPLVLPSNQLMLETPTAATMRLDGGHPALELVNTVYAVVGGPVEFDVLATPDDLVTFAARTGIGEAVADVGALRAARELRAALDPLLRAHLDAGSVVATSWGTAEVAPAARAFERAVLDAQRAARLSPGYEWTWDGPLAPVHRLAHAASLLLTGPDLALLRCCDACCWLFLDRAGKGRRWCSMADCGTEAKKRRYVEKRRRLRAR